MKKEHVMDAMDYIDPELVAQAGHPARRGGKRWVRPALIAACLCLALAGTAAAARELAGIRVDLDSGAKGRYTVTGGIAYFPADSFSQEVRDMAERGAARSFRTWDRLEEFVGRELMDNPVLEAASPGARASANGLEGASTHILLMASACEQGLFAMMTQDNYRLDNVQLFRRALVYTDLFEDRWPSDDDPAVILYYPTLGQVSEEEYTTPGGLTASIVRVESNYTEYQAHFSINGVRCWITASALSAASGYDYTPGDSDHALEVLKTVLDGFVVK